LEDSTEISNEKMQFIFVTSMKTLLQNTASETAQSDTQQVLKST